MSFFLAVEIGRYAYAMNDINAVILSDNINAINMQEGESMLEFGWHELTEKLVEIDMPSDEFNEMFYALPNSEYVRIVEASIWSDGKVETRIDDSLFGYTNH